MADRPDPLNPKKKLHTYEEVRPDRTTPAGGATNIEAIQDHLVKHIGGEFKIFHEIKSEAVHLDVIIMQPTESEPYWTLMTSGMSDRPMKDGSLAEMMLRLPADWKVPMRDGEEVWKGKDGERWYWPVRVLKQMARFPHVYKTAFAVGHTIDNGQPADPWSHGTAFNAAFFANGRTLPEAFDEIDLGDGRKIQVLALYPLYAEESAFARANGSEALWAKFADAEISEVVQADRPCLVPREAPAPKRSFWDRLRGK